jgi:hypothetical protein
MINITNTVITRHGEAKTVNARYQIEYSVSGGELTRVSASIFESSSGENPNEVYLGNIYFDNGSVNCSLQAGTKAALYFVDFEDFMEEIKKDVKQLTVK